MLLRNLPHWEPVPPLLIIRRQKNRSHPTRVGRYTSGGSSSSSSEGRYIRGQPFFTPCGRRIVYTWWDAGGGEMEYWFGSVYYYQYPYKMYCAHVGGLQSSGAGGGKENCSTTAHSPMVANLWHGGYAILLPNFRGSTGYGQSFLEGLPRNIGRVDVDNVVKNVKLISYNVKNDY